MFTPSPSRNYWLTILLIASLFLSGVLPNSNALADRKRKPVVVSFGQPNIWSLEQAHYLLARMHMTNIDLQAKALTDDDLDANRITGTRIQIIKQLLEIGAEFDQGKGFENQRIVEKERFNDDRRRDLVTSRDQLRDDSLRLEIEKNKLISERKTITDPDSARAKELDAQIEQKTNDQAAMDKRADAKDSEIAKLNEPSGQISSPTPSTTPFDSKRLPASLLEKLSEEQLKKLAANDKDPRLNATTMLDNSVQMQYEIIAKQLTLLRDEVGPGERLVFLELPQSVYTTPGPGDEKMAQAWWHVNGYTRTDPLVRLLLEMYEVELKWAKIEDVQAFKDRATELDRINCPVQAEDIPKDRQNDHIFVVFAGLKCERQIARNVLLDKLYREANTLFARVEQNGARDTSEMVEAVRRLIQVTQQTRDIERQGPKNIEKEGASINSDLSVKDMGKESLTSSATSTTQEKKRREEIQQLKTDLLKILSDENSLKNINTNAPESLKNLGTASGAEFERGIEFIRLDDELARAGDNDIKRRTVRAVDIIPRQSSLNVNDIQSTVKATGILAAFKFLFGFAGQVNFQRQKEQFEQYVHQEMYASGFGKGNRDFGWTFGALPGTNRVAPGVRTTYAALVVPEDAESIILSARGCYFPRKSYQPLDFEDTGHTDWKDDDHFRNYNCGDDQTYIVPVPNGGKANSFWVTNIDYQDGKNGNEFTTVSVRGNNFSAQMGVLINGVPLAPTVGLAQPTLMPKKNGPNNTLVLQPANNCTTDTTICGSYERVDTEQIVFSFKMPNNFVGTPTITLIAPGKSVDLNSLRNITINRRTNNNLNNNAAFMFGRRPEMQLLGFTPGVARVSGILSGGGFTDKDNLYINGVEITGTQKQFKSANLYWFEFDLNADDVVKLVLVRDNEIINQSIPNPAALKIINARSSYVPPTNNQPGVLTVMLVGKGFAPNLVVQATGGQQPQLVYLSTEQVQVRVNSAAAPSPSAVVRITLTNNATHGTDSWAITGVP
jgi:hypothetical protein